MSAYFSRRPIALDWDVLLERQDTHSQGPAAEEAEPETVRCPPNPALLARCRRGPEIRKVWL